MTGAYMWSLTSIDITPFPSIFSSDLTKFVFSVIQSLGIVFWYKYRKGQDLLNDRIND